MSGSTISAKPSLLLVEKAPSSSMATIVSEVVPFTDHTSEPFSDGCIYDDANIKRVKYAYDKGHQVASHTWGHKALTTLTWDQSKAPSFV